MPWHSFGAACEEPVNAISKRPYRGINILALWAASIAHGYHTGLWETYKQWAELGAQVKKGEHGTFIVLWKSIEANEKSEDDEEENKSKH
jgi:antirestriction protein ArdC